MSTTFIVNGGESTTTSRTADLSFAETAMLIKFSIPIILDNTTSSTKKVVVTVTISDKSYITTETFEKTETGERLINVNLGYEVQESGVVKLNFRGTKARINYGTYTYPIVLPNGVSVTQNAFNFTIEYDTSRVWQITDDNDGYPWRTSVPDTSEFNGYQDPKPLNSWKIDANNDGYPWVWGFTEIPAGGQNIWFKTANGLVPLMAYYKGSSGLIPLTFIKVKEQNGGV